ncbi:MAG: tautomerase family protein [Nitrospiraceae bacterium]|nr:tautomerase family protein [Nitrospiraceae bacterium]
MIRKERIMPHIIVKLWPGRSEEQKAWLAEEIVKDVVAVLKSEEKSVSVAIEEIKPEDWPEKVYRPDILGNSEKLYKKPGYNPFE